MPIDKTFLRGLSRAAFVLLALAACADDQIVTPTFGSGCNVGELTIGRSVTGAFHELSPCIDERHFYSGYRAPYESYDVKLEKGKAYLFRMEHRPDAQREGRDALDALLTLWGKNDDGVSVPLAISDQEGGGDDAEFFFVAPRSGTFQLVASSYYGVYEPEYFGGYTLSAAACPVLGRIEGSGTEEFELEESDCLRHEAGFTGGFENDPIAAYRFIAIEAEPNERITVEVEADEFLPAWEIFGPGFDTYANLYQGSDYDRANANGTRYIDVRGTGGIVTLAIGVLEREGPSNEFSVKVTRGPTPEMLVMARSAVPMLKMDFGAKR